MKSPKKFIYLIIIVLFILLFIFFSDFFSVPNESEYQNIEPIAMHTNGQHFAGSSSCVECHADIYKTHVETAHYNSSAIANRDNIKGSFENGKNKYELNEHINFSMEVKKDGFYQQTFYKSDSLIGSHRFDVVIGSGVKGQTYLNWSNNALNQIQVSYFEPTNSWVNSPGYPNNNLFPDRPILGGCLECHATFAENTPTFNKRNAYNKSNMVYGIDCERCHGPSMDHVNFHKKNPDELKPMHILSYKDLSRQQKLDACALCHSGLRVRGDKAAFSFMTGDLLEQLPIPHYDESSIDSLDVHGNQYGLLSASKCFIKSETMDCSTCHNVHKKERNNIPSFIQRCLSCHGETHEVKCSVEASISEAMGNNCIQCHMPLTPSKVMRIQASTDTTLTSVQVRTHFIGIYTDTNSHLK